MLRFRVFRKIVLVVKNPHAICIEAYELEPNWPMIHRVIPPSLNDVSQIFPIENILKSASFPAESSHQNDACFFGTTSEVPKISKVESPLTIFEVVATQISVIFTPENWGFMIQFDERAYFSDGLKLNHQLLFFGGGFGPEDL